MVRKIRNSGMYPLLPFPSFVTRHSSFVILLFSLLLFPLPSISQSGEKNEPVPANSPAVCWYSETTDPFVNFYNGMHILDYHVDVFGNSYVAGYVSSGFYGYSPVWNMVLEKFDKNGLLKWRKVHDGQNLYAYNDKFRSIFCSAIASDTSGNIYITGNYGCGKLIMDSITITSANNYGKGYIAKLDSNGKTMWVIYSYTPNGGVNTSSGGTDIKYINDNKILAGFVGSGDIIFADGSSQVFFGSFHVLEFDKDGHFKKITSSAYSPNGGPQMFYNPDLAYWNANQLATISPKISYSKKSDKVFVAGKFMTSLTVVYPSMYLSAVNTGANGFVAVMDSTGWKKAFITYGSSDNFSPGSGQTSIDIFTVHAIDTSDCIYYAARSTSPMVIPGQSTTLSNGSFIVKFDTAGNVKWNNAGPYCFVRSLSRSASNNIMLYGEFNDTLTLPSQTSPPVSVITNGQRDLFLGSLSPTGNMLWLKNAGSTGTDYASRMQTHPCSENMYFTGGLAATCTFAGTQLTNAGNNIFVCKYSDNGNCTDTSCFTVVSPGAGMEEYSPKAWMRCYPNPTSGLISFASSEKICSVEIFNPVGECVYSADSPLMKAYTADLGKMPKGIYFYKAKAKEGEEITGKIIVQ